MHRLREHPDDAADRPSSCPRGSRSATGSPIARAICSRARGSSRCMSFPFVSEAELAALRPRADDPRRHALALRNPIKDGERLLAHAARALAAAPGPPEPRRGRSTAVRPLRGGGRVLAGAGRPAGPGDGALPREPLWAAGADHRVAASPSSGRARPGPGVLPARRGSRKSFCPGWVIWHRCEAGRRLPTSIPGASLAIWSAIRESGSVGELHPRRERATSRSTSRARCSSSNLERALAAKKREFEFREVSREPSVRRDLAVLVERDAAGRSAARTRSAKVAGPDLVSVEIFDRYEGAGVPEGRVSLAFRSSSSGPTGRSPMPRSHRAIERVIVAALATASEAELRLAATSIARRPGHDQGRIVEQIYEQVGFSKKESAELVEKVFETIKETLARRREGQDLRLRQLRRAGQERTQGPQSADRAGDPARSAQECSRSSRVSC